MGNKAVAFHDTLPHVEWVDIDGNHIASEIIVIKRDKRNNDLYFIKTEDMDEIDRKRITSILKKRDAGKYELWDLLDNTTLGNGENALTYFHQLVKVLTEQGTVFTPAPGRQGIPVLRPETNAVPVQQRGPSRPKNS
jgi:hypothetical protein